MNLAFDRASLLALVPGTTLLASVECALAREGLTLRVAGLEPNASILDTTVADWLGRGAPGAASAFADPADHLVAGLVARLADGRVLEVHPSPRRAVGPDLIALFVGAGDRFGTIERVWLRIHPAGTRTVAIPTDGLLEDAPVSPAESALLDAIARELAPSV